MMKRIRNIFVCFFTLFFCCRIFAAAGEIEYKVSSVRDTTKIISGEFIMEVKAGVIDLGRKRGAVKDAVVNSKYLRSLNKKYRLVSIERLFSGTRKDAPSDIYLFRFAKDVKADKLMAVYEKNQDVFYVEPNYIMRIQEK